MQNKRDYNLLNNELYVLDEIQIDGMPEADNPVPLNEAYLKGESN